MSDTPSPADPVEEPNAPWYVYDRHLNLLHITPTLAEARRGRSSTGASWRSRTVKRSPRTTTGTSSWRHRRSRVTAAATSRPASSVGTGSSPWAGTRMRRRATPNCGNPPLILPRARKASPPVTSPVSHTSVGDSSTSAQPPKQRKHLMTPGQPRPPSRPSSMSTAQVQKWVVTVLTIAVLGHLAEALVIFALMAPEDHPSSRIGLLVIAGVVGLLAAGGVRAIHRRRIPSLWLLLGLTPAVVGAYLAYGR